MEQQGLQGPRIALLIDFDNVILGVDDPPGFDVELVVNALRSRGVVVLGRAYGDWYRHNRHRRKLMEQGIELVETPAFGPIIKNSADIRIALDAFEIGMTQSHISEFCLVSGDSDFLPLVKRLQLLGKSVIVIAGNKFTSELIRRNCNEFISYENLLAESVGATEDATTLEGAYALLSRTVNTMSERGQDARSSAVKQMMLQLNPVFSERSFGCSQFKQFLNKACSAGVIRLGRRDGSSGEYQVLLIDDNGDETESVTEELEVADSTEESLISDLKTKPVRRPHKQTTQAPKPAEEIHNESDEGLSDNEHALNVANNASTVSPARRGRLRFSGRTWRSGGTSTKTEETTAEETAQPASEETQETKQHEVKPEASQTEKSAKEQEKTSAEKPAQKTEPPQDEKAETAPKSEEKKPARAAKKEADKQEAEKSSAKAPADKPVTEEKAETAEEKPKAKTVAKRRTSSRTTTTKTRSTAKTKKADEAAAEPDKATAQEPEPAAEPKPAAPASESTEPAAEEKPKPKTAAKRRTSSRTTKKKAEEADAAAAEKPSQE